jgi:hypothetical protein
MGFFDRLAAKKNSPSSVPQPVATETSATNPIRPRLDAARAHLDVKDLPAALTIYEEVLAHSGDRADVLVTISGDLGSTGHLAPIIDLIAPRYDGQRHGPATGLNLLQAYLALRNPDSAQHVLDILFSLNRPELEERLHGFSNAIADLIVQGAEPLPQAGDPANEGTTAAVPKISLASITKPIWFYGLEPLADQILPLKSERLRRVAFAQLALPGAYPDLIAAMAKPEDELGRLSRAIPMWLSETFYFSPHYEPAAAVGLLTPPGGGASQPVIFSAEWTMENLRQLVDTSTGGLDYIFTGALRQKGGDYELLIRVWEVKKFRERKQFLVRWTPVTMDAELKGLHQQLRKFMEWSPEKSGLVYAEPASPRVWLDALGASLGLFLAEKKLIAAGVLPPLAPSFDQLALQTENSVSASLAWLTLQSRAASLGLAGASREPTLSADPLVASGRETLAL